MATNNLELFTSRREKIGWIEFDNDGKISCNVSTSLENVADDLEKLIKDAISNGLTVRRAEQSGDKIFEVQMKVSSKEEGFIQALKDKINRTKFDNQRIFAVSCQSQSNGLTEGGAK